jgi:DNA-binding transcriptional LysR family regulator
LFERTRAGVRITRSGRPVIDQIRRAIGELIAVAAAAHRNGGGRAGEIRLGFRIPPVSGLLFKALTEWRLRHPTVVLKFFELNDHELRLALTERRLDAAFVTHHALWPGATSIPMVREAIAVALPFDHALVSHERLTWDQLRAETFLTQGWNDSQTAREFFASLLGSGVAFESHATSKQSILAFVAAGYGITLVTESQAQIALPGIIFRPVADANAWVDVDLVWSPQSEDAAAGVFIAFMRDLSVLKHS